MKPGEIIHRGKTKKGKVFIVRYPVMGDLKKLLDYFNTISKEQTFIRFQGEQLTLDEEKKYLESLLEKIEKKEAVKLFAFYQNQLIALADIKLLDKTSNHVGVFGITVDKQFRGEGIGKKLMNLVIEEAKKNLVKLKIITLGVFSNNPIACKIYGKMGFTQYGKLPKGILHRKKYVDHIFMYKNI